MWKVKVNGKDSAILFSFADAVYWMECLSQKENSEFFKEVMDRKSPGVIIEYYED